MSEQRKTKALGHVRKAMLLHWAVVELWAKSLGSCCVDSEIRRAFCQLGCVGWGTEQVADVGINVGVVGGGRAGGSIGRMPQ